MSVVMVFRGLPDGRATIHYGQYLKAFDFEAYGGQGEVSLTPDADGAKRFADMAEALAFYRTSPKCRPLRPDGRPNRPLTATNWEFKTV